MGYDLHLTKADDWVDAKDHPIEPADWLALVDSDHELSMSPSDFYERRTPDGNLERVSATAWIAGSSECTFWFQDGEVTAKNPDDAATLKLIGIAERLGARVLGDDGEVYERSDSAPGWVAIFE